MAPSCAVQDKAGAGPYAKKTPGLAAVVGVWLQRCADGVARLLEGRLGARNIFDAVQQNEVVNRAVVASRGHGALLPRNHFIARLLRSLGVGTERMHSSVDAFN